MLHHLSALAVKTLRDREGVTAAEYAILAAAIVLAVGTAVTAFGGRLTTAFTSIFP